jgi:dTDP-glucose 4,6-dehydratase/UDP-glucose 4-epimerase
MMIGLGYGGEYELIAFPPERKAIDIGDYYSDFSLIDKELGWMPKIGLKEGLKKTIDYYNANHQHYWESGQ